MIRNIDMTALRSFVTVAETGGVTRAAQQLNLTQSAVSMQVKRLEDMLGQPLLDRSGRGVSPSAQGEQLLSYGRRMLSLNDEVMAQMTDSAFEGEVRLGVPADIVLPFIPTILKRFDREFPRAKIILTSSYTKRLREMLDAGELDMTLTTEGVQDGGGETLATHRLVWVGARNGIAWRQRPLRLAFEKQCNFRIWVQDVLDEAGIVWEHAVETRSTRTVEACVSADLAVHAMVETAVTPHMSVIESGSALPSLPLSCINFYRAAGAREPIVDALAEIVRETYTPTKLAAE
ncbi:MAG: LysR family transcriptional regulator [Pseudomonadota bacterium]